MTEPTVFIEYTSAPQNRQPFDAGNLQRCQETFLAIKGFLNKEMPQVKVLRTAFPIAPEHLIQMSQNNLHIEPFEVYVSDQLLFSRKKSGKWPNILVITSQIKKVIQEKISLVPLIDEANGNNFKVAKLPIIRNNSNHRPVLKVNKRKPKKPVDLLNQTTITESNSQQLYLKQASSTNILSESEISKPEAVARAKSPLERRIKSSPVDERKGAEVQSLEKENKIRSAKQRVGLERKHKRIDHKSNVGDVSLMQIKEKSMRTTLRKKDPNETSKGWAKNLNTFQKLMDTIQGKDSSSSSSKPQEKVFLKKRFRYKADTSAYSSLLHRSNSITITHFQETSEAVSYKFLGDENDDIKILQTPSLLNIALNKQKKDSPVVVNQFSLTRSRSLEYDEASEKADPKTLFNFHQSFSPLWTKEKPLFTESSNSNPFRLGQSPIPQEEIRTTAEFGTNTLNRGLDDDDASSHKSSPQKSSDKKSPQAKKIKKIHKKSHLELSESSLSPTKQKVSDAEELKKLESETRMIAFEHISNDASNLVFSSLGQIRNETIKPLPENLYNFVVSKKELNLGDKSFQFINSSRDLKETRFTPQFAPFQTDYN